MLARVLIVAGSDSSGGAGIQADTKTVTALGGYAATAITALTAQDTTAVHAVVGVEPDFIRRQMRVVLDDIGADAVKTGMLHSAVVIEAVAAELESLSATTPVVVDPVMVAQSGGRLIEHDAVATLRARLLPRATVLTPNAPEAGALAGIDVNDVEDLVRAGRELLALGPRAVLVKGGHLPGADVVDVLVTEHGVERFADRRIDTRHTHGTGCTLASAIATGLAQGLPLDEGVRRARRYLRAALAGAPGLGRGQGPVDHTITVAPLG